jgi:hypothetical protein
MFNNEHLKSVQMVYSLPVIDLMKLCHGRVISL